MIIYDEPDWEDMDVPDEFEAVGCRMPRKRPWPTRDNCFTKLLKSIDEGIKVELTYLHEGMEHQKEFTIEQSPRDSVSAEKYKNEALGITVKELTYEIRAALKLTENDKAVVVSKIEDGTPAALARINAFELIRAVNGKDIAEVDEFKSMIENAKEKGEKSVRITVEWMGKTRIADLKFESEDQEDTLNKVLRLIPAMQGAHTMQE